MACSRGFFSGLRDFLAAPLRLWLMHKRLVHLNPSEKHLKTVQQHHLEHTRRMQLRERLHDSYSSSCTGRLSDTTTRVSASVDLVDSGGLIQPLVRIWLINVGLILTIVGSNHWCVAFIVSHGEKGDVNNADCDKDDEDADDQNESVEIEDGDYV
ncbi:uncharacterized protein DEA37_0005860 [Paragonimus westermani]|uniref:Uncharacterized protein n=1 Tax=Paragonimus westermani TaxID=34504 RepID=A0A5J4NC63_9TREM|nr:uncharacterized protein DEA37_0005860 [Paragonimus westermani]